MPESQSLRSRIVSAVIDALERIGATLGIDVKLEGDALHVSANLAGVRGVTSKPATATSPTGKSRGRPKGTTNAPVATEKADSGLADKVMALLNEARNQTGMNLKMLAKAVGIRKKTKLKPVVAELEKAGKLTTVTGGRYRRTDVKIKAGRKPAGESAEAESAQAPKSAAKASAKKKKRPMSPAQKAALAKAWEARRASGKKAARAAKAAAKKPTVAKAKPATKAVAATKKASRPRKAEKPARKAVSKKKPTPSVEKRIAKPAKKSEKAAEKPAESEMTETKTESVETAQ